MSSAIRDAAIGLARSTAGLSLSTNASLNRLLGRIGPQEYVTLVSESERLDPVADPSALRDLRRRLLDAGGTVGYPDRIASNDRIYGIKQAIFGAGGLGLGSPAVEHGLFFGDYLIAEDTIQTAAPTLVTMGNYRRRVLRRRQGLPAFAVGPYLHYANPHYEPAVLAAEKRKLGRTLLVFPTHSTPDSTLGSMHADHFGWLDEIATDFTTVLVCAYWWNLDDPQLRDLERRGYRTVSCGMMHDRNFMPRLKTLLSWADLAVGDNIGTHVGYALGQGVPFRLTSPVEVKLDAAAKNKNPSRLGVRAVDTTIIRTLQGVLARPDASLEESRQVAEPYWGFNKLRSPAELSGIKKICRDIVSLSGGIVSLYERAARSLNARYKGSDEELGSLLSEALEEY